MKKLIQLKTFEGFKDKFIKINFAIDFIQEINDNIIWLTSEFVIKGIYSII